MMSQPTPWNLEREHLNAQVEELCRQGICPSCYDMRTQGALFGQREPIFEDDLFLIILERFPRMRGHTIVLYKPLSNLQSPSAATAPQTPAPTHRYATTALRRHQAHCE